jgi:hypothetical protein
LNLSGREARTTDPEVLDHASYIAGRMTSLGGIARVKPDGNASRPLADVCSHQIDR